MTDVEGTSVALDGPEGRPASASLWRKVGGWLGTELSKALMPALVAGFVSLAVSLAVAHWQSEDAKDLVRTENQRQALVSLQRMAEIDLQATADVIRFQRMCAGSVNSWRDCADIAPALEVFRQQSAKIVNARAAVADQQLRDLSIQFETICLEVTKAATSGESDRLFGQAVDLYLQIAHRAGTLSQA